MYDLREITDYPEWDEFVEKSEQGTIFSISKWMQLFDTPFKIHGCYRRGELRGGIAAFDHDGTLYSGGAQCPLTPFQGIISGVFPGIKYANTISIWNELADSIIPLFECGDIFNHYTFTDIRPFLWADYQPIIRYTFVVTLNGATWNEMEKDTRAEVTKAISNKVEVKQSDDIDRFCELYHRTFERKGIPQSVPDSLIKRLFKELNAELYLCKSAGVVMMFDSKRAYYILGASEDPGNGASSYCLWYAFQNLMGRYKEVDLVGCNDPHIALFKRGFGGILKPYFGVTRT